MGTHGYVAFKYKGIYYIFYNHGDSYLAHLGNLVVKEVNAMINYNKVEEYKSRLLRIPLRENESEGDNYFHSFNESIYHYDCFRYYTSEYEPCSEYIYIIDFDINKLKIETYDGSIYNFNLYDIPSDWDSIIENYTSYEADSQNISEDEDNEIILNKIKELEDSINKLKLKLK
jgi:hypothetical protein